MIQYGQGVEGVQSAPPRPDLLFRKDLTMSKLMQDDRSIVKFIFLSIITCGLYEFWFFWWFVKDINQWCEEEGSRKRSSNYFVASLLAVLTLGIYTFFWYYRLGDMLGFVARRRNVDTPVSGGYMIICLVLNFFFGIALLVAMAEMINAANEIAHQHNTKVRSASYYSYYENNGQGAGV